MQERNPVRPERCEHQVEIFGEEVGVFVDDENGEVAGDPGREH
jgi:hypothetical protein